MGDHRHNPRAVAARKADHAAAMQAAKLAKGKQRAMRVAIGGTYRLKPNVMVVAPDKVRTNEGGVMEVQTDEGVWAPPPEGVVLLDEGAAPDPEHMDYVVMVFSEVTDESAILGAKKRQSLVPLGEALRVPAAELLAQHERNFAGPEEQGS